MCPKKNTPRRPPILKRQIYTKTHSFIPVIPVPALHDKRAGPASRVHPRATVGAAKAALLLAEVAHRAAEADMLAAAEARLGRVCGSCRP